MNKFQYLILPANSFHCREMLEVHDQAYALWQKVWGAVFASKDPNASLRSDDFHRADFVSCIRHESEVIAVHLYSRFDLESGSAREHGFFSRNYCPEFIQQMRAEGRSRILAMEQLAVARRWRGTAAGTSVAALIGSLGTKLYLHSGCDALVTSARNSMKVNQLGAMLGFETVIPGVLVHDEPSDLMRFVLRDRRTLPDETGERLANYLWEERQDWTGVTAPRPVANPDSGAIPEAA